MKKYFVAILCLVTSILWSADYHKREKSYKAPRKGKEWVKKCGYNNYETSPHTSKRQKECLRPYLLPATHPLKKVLDRIFSKQRAIEDEKTLQTAGFHILSKQLRSHLIVASHPQLPGMLLKIYVDKQTKKKHNKASWIWLWRRCQGAKKIRQTIKSCGAKHFVVPDKWIYPLPLSPAPKKGKKYERKNEVLIVTDMGLVPLEESIEMWKNKITEQHLDEFYTIISRSGGGSYRADNVAYTRKGQFAFIDTEYPYKSPNYDKISPYLSKEMLLYWKKCVELGRQQAAGQRH